MPAILVGAGARQAGGRVGAAAGHDGIVLIKACLNGGRSRDDHPRCPTTPEELATEAAAAVAAGAGALHVHPRGPGGAESMDGSDVAAAVEALRAVVAVPIGVTTGAWILPDPDDRRRAIAGWTVLPDFASVNFHEDGAADVAELLLDRGVGVEAGLWSARAAEVLADRALAERCVRVLLEPTEQDPIAGLARVAVIESVLDGVGVSVPRLLHGFESTAWDMVAESARRGYDTRIGFEDTLRLPTGELAATNAHLVRAAIAILEGGRAR